jgi:drug/metabolite transporter, DME family
VIATGALTFLSRAHHGYLLLVSGGALFLYRSYSHPARFGRIKRDDRFIYLPIHDRRSTAAGIFAPGIGRTLSYFGIEKIGVARAVPIVNSSPIFASMFAVLFLGEDWALQNVAGTLLVIAGVVMLSMAKPPAGEWRKLDVVFPILGAIAFGISTSLRKAGLGFVDIPLGAAACTATTGFLFSVILLQTQGGQKALKLTRNSAGWFFSAGIFNTAALLSVFYALSYGKVVIVEPLVSSNPVLTLVLTSLFLRDLEALNWRVISGASLAVAGTILVVLVK